MKRGSRGSLIAEAAVTMLAFAFILFASVDFGGAWWRCQTLQTAVLEAARYAVVHGAGDPNPSTRADGPHADTVKTLVKQNAWGLRASNFVPQSVTVDWTAADGVTSDPTAQPGSTVHIHARYPMGLTLMKKFAPDADLGGGCTVPKLCEADVKMIVVGPPVN